MLAHERLELGGQPRVAAERELGIDAELERGESQLFQARDRRLRERGVGEVRERCAAPEAERLVEQPTASSASPRANARSPSATRRSKCRRSNCPGSTRKA